LERYQAAATEPLVRPLGRRPWVESDACKLGIVGEAVQASKLDQLVLHAREMQSTTFLSQLLKKNSISLPSFPSFSLVSVVFFLPCSLAGAHLLVSLQRFLKREKSAQIGQRKLQRLPVCHA
jgi:hypothetical protein